MSMIIVLTSAIVKSHVKSETLALISSLKSESSIKTTLTLSFRLKVRSGLLTH